MVDVQDELSGATSCEQIDKYRDAKGRWVAWLNINTESTDEQKQLRLSEILSEVFGAEFSFVGFYDKRDGVEDKIFIG